MAEARVPLTVKGLIAALVDCNDSTAIPEFTLDGETYFAVFGVDAGEAITLDVEPAVYITKDGGDDGV